VNVQNVSLSRPLTMTWYLTFTFNISLCTLIDLEKPDSPTEPIHDVEEPLKRMAT
jgi:hypothetical protein